MKSHFDPDHVWKSDVIQQNSEASLTEEACESVKLNKLTDVLDFLQWPQVSTDKSLIIWYLLSF